jgi:CBS domain-containing protein
MTGRTAMLRVRDLMSPDVVSVAPELSLRSALELFAQRQIGGAPVMARQRLLGVITGSDILSFQASTPPVPAGGPDQAEWELEPGEEWQEGDEAPAAFFSDAYLDVGADVAERFAETGGPEWDLLAEHTVAEAMTRTLLTVSPDTELVGAARIMSRHRVHRLLVVDHGALVGVLSSMDLVRAVGEGRIP